MEQENKKEIPMEIDPLDEASNIMTDVLEKLGTITANPQAMEPIHIALLTAQTAALVDIAKNLRVLSYWTELRNR